MTHYDQVSEAAAFLRVMFGPFNPRVGIVLGSGLGAVAKAVAEPVVVPYAEIPHFPRSTVEGHTGRMVAGLLGGVPGDGSSSLGWNIGAAPHRPFKIVYASLYADVRPSFIVDITPFIEQRHQSLMAYRSQYANQAAGGGLFVPEEEIRERTFAEARHYGLLAGVRYGEPFVQKEVGLVDDLTLLPVQSI